MSSLTEDQNDIECDGECPSVDSRIRQVQSHSSWLPKTRKDQLQERNDSGFQSQDFELSLKSSQQNSHRCVTESTDITERLSNLTVIENSQTKHSIDEGICTSENSIGPAVSHKENLTKTSEIITYDDILRSLPHNEIREIYQQDEDGDTQLHMAIIHVIEPLALYFINKAPSRDWLNIPNNLCQTPLHLAVLTRQEKIVRRLMAAGASVDVRDLQGNTPLHIACREGLENIVKCLLKPVFYQETLENQYDIPYQRIPQDLEFKNYEGHTCLHLAAQGSHIEVMKLLLGKGAKINTQDGKSGRTILHYAAETGNRILLDFVLKQRKRNINCVTYGGLTPIDLAAGRKFADVVAILKDEGADCSSLLYRDDDSDDDDDSEMYDDFCINGEPVMMTTT